MAGSKLKKIIWRKKAQKDFEALIDYITLDSAFAANKVGLEILQNITYLQKNPEIFVKDNWKRNNDGTYRVFFVYHYRVTYRITDSTVYVLRIRHTSQEPKEY